MWSEHYCLIARLSFTVLRRYEARSCTKLSCRMTLIAVVDAELEFIFFLSKKELSRLTRTPDTRS